MKKLTTKIMLALTVLGFAGGTAFTPLAQTAAAETPKSRVWVGQVNTYRERYVTRVGRVVYDRWSQPQEVRCSHGYNLVEKNHAVLTYDDGSYLEWWNYEVRTY